MFCILSTAQNMALRLASRKVHIVEYDLLLCEIVLSCESLRIHDTPHFLCASIQSIPTLHLKAPTGGLLHNLTLGACSLSTWGEIAEIQSSASSKDRVVDCLGGTTVALKVCEFLAFQICHRIHGTAWQIFSSSLWLFMEERRWSIFRNTEFLEKHARGRGTLASSQVWRALSQRNKTWKID